MFKCIIVEKDLVHPHNGVVSCYKIKEDFYELAWNDFQAKLLSEMSKMQRDICMMLFLYKQRESMYIHAYTHGKSKSEINEISYLQERVGRRMESRSNKERVGGRM